MLTKIAANISAPILVPSKHPPTPRRVEQQHLPPLLCAMGVRLQASVLFWQDRSGLYYINP